MPPKHDLHPMQVLFSVPDDPPPELEGDFSDEFVDFVEVCLRKNPKERPSAAQLLQHPFITVSLFGLLRVGPWKLCLFYYFIILFLFLLHSSNQTAETPAILLSLLTKTDGQEPSYRASMSLEDEAAYKPRGEFFHALLIPFFFFLMIINPMALLLRFSILGF